MGKQLEWLASNDENLAILCPYNVYGVPNTAKAGGDANHLVWFNKSEEQAARTDPPFDTKPTGPDKSGLFMG